VLDQKTQIVVAGGGAGGEVAVGSLDATRTATGSIPADGSSSA